MLIFSYSKTIFTIFFLGVPVLGKKYILDWLILSVGGMDMMSYMQRFPKEAYDWQLWSLLGY